MTTERELKYDILNTRKITLGKRIKYVEHADSNKEHLYEVKGIYNHCVLLEDIFDRTRICPCYGKLSLMLNGAE